tara:strand:+ start:3204 stop:3575 length:372 start_codon:yes stop_codon:yes gene_type:complete
MTAFNTAWDLMKMPYHGTDIESAKKIMLEGLKPSLTHFMEGYLPHEGNWSWATDSLDEAREYAKHGASTGKRPANLKGAVIHISDDFPSHQKLRRSKTSGGHLHSMYDKVIPPKYLKLLEGEM